MGLKYPPEVENTSPMKSKQKKNKMGFRIVWPNHHGFQGLPSLKLTYPLEKEIPIGNHHF